VAVSLNNLAAGVDETRCGRRKVCKTSPARAANVAAMTAEHPNSVDSKPAGNSFGWGSASVAMLYTSSLSGSCALVSVFVSQSSEHGASDDLYIQPKAPVVNVVQIVLKPVRD